MERRSTHSTTPRRKYTTDAFEGIEELQDAPSDHEERISYNNDADDSAEEFEIEAEAPSDIDDDEMSGVEGPLDDEDFDLANDAGADYLDNSGSVADDDDESLGPNTPSRPAKRRRLPPQSPKVNVDGERTYIRGLEDLTLSSTNENHKRQFLFGGLVADSDRAYAARDKWAYEPTLPSRVADANGFGGMHANFFVEERAVEKMMEDEAKTWAGHGGLRNLFKKQLFSTLSVEDARTYSGADSDGKAAFVMGPYNSQKLYELAIGESMRLIDAWKQDQSYPSNYKNGFILNLGERIHCLDWTSNQTGPHHYLAASVLPKTKASHPPFGAPEAPAFTPQPAHKSNIQIWRLRRRYDGCIDTDTPCSLHVMLCTAWGVAKDFKFCGMPIEKTRRSDLGLLAGIWGDGAIRVLDLTQISHDSTTSYIHVEKAAFESRPPNTVCTCITWVSSTRIAVGCANGFVAIWDLPTSTNSTSTNPRPLIYTSLSSTYILSITTCYPSRPHFLLTTSMAGYTTLTDMSRSGQSLGSPANTVSSSRIRIAQRGLAWYEFAQLALHLEDSHTLKGSPVRRFFANVNLTKASSNIISVATSPCHPFVLVGSASGDVLATNPLEKMFEKKGTMWQQEWFAHEWRRPTAEESITPAGAGDSSNGQETSVKVGAHGLSRISEGFKAEPNFVSKDDRAPSIAFGRVVVATVFEEKSAVTALMWNPNPEVGGWAAAGTGTGLLRVENIAS